MRYDMTSRKLRVGSTFRLLTTLSLLAASVACSQTGVQNATQAPAGSVPAPDRAVAPALVESWGGDIELAGQEAGRLARVLVQEGQKVKAGELLAVLEDTQQQAALATSGAEIAEAEASLARARRGATRQELTQLAQERDAAAARARLSADDAARSTRLHERKATTDAEWQRATRQAEADKSTAAALEARYRNLAGGTRAEDLAIARARLEGAKARLAQAEAALSRRKVTAPVDATVLWSRYHAGEYYAPGAEALFTLGDVTKYQVRAEVDEIDVGRVRVGARARIRTDGGGAPVAEGTVVRVSPRMGRKKLSTESPTSRGDTRVREVLVEAPAKEPLLPGLRVWVEILNDAVAASP